VKITVNDIQVNYELSGKMDGDTVILSHSLGSSFSMWNPQMETLSEHFKVLRYDTRGHGGTDTPPGAYMLDQLGADAVGLLDALKIDKAHWVGLSMGGMIGQCLGLNYSDRFKSLSLCDTAAIMPDDFQSMRQERINIAQNQGMQALADPTMERWFTEPYLAQDPPGVKFIRDIFLKTAVTGFVGCMGAIGELNYLERLSEIQLPTLVIVGKEDMGTPVSAAEAINKRIPNSKLVVIDSAAHLCNVEQADVFNDVLMEFLLSQ
jgi:3-oxoadipate enol-lactonase